MLKGLKRGTYYFSLVLTLLLFSCENQEYAELNPAKQTSGQEQSQEQKFSIVTDNAFEKYGKDHRHSLKQLANENHFPNSSDRQVYITIEKYLSTPVAGTNQLTLSKAKINFNSLYSGASTKSALINLSISHFSEHCKNNSGFDQDVWHYIDTLSDLYHHFNQASNFKSEVTSLRESIAKDNALTDDQKTTLLAGYGVANYSLTYWHKVRNNSNNQWHNIFENGLKTSGEREALMLRLSIASSMAFFNVTDNLNEADHIISDARKSGAIQAAFNPGPPLIDTDNF